LLALVATLAGCAGHGSQPAPLPAPVVTVSQLLESDNLDSEEFNGRTDAVETVEVRARATGYLDKALFEAGSVVKKGQLLFEIDPRTYQADLARAEAEITRNEARLQRLSSDLSRARRLTQGAAMSREEFDKIVGDQGETDAALKAARANAERYKLDLGFTKVTAPIGGRISRALVTAGNLVNGGPGPSTLLTTIVSIDPVYAYFDVDEHNVLRIQRMIMANKFKAARDKDGRVPIFLRLQDEKGFPHEGMVDFVDNRVDPNTGTLRVRAVFPNRDGLLSPGLFVRLRLPVGDPHKAVLVNERALGTDQGQRFLYVVNDGNEVVQRPVTVGTLRDGMRVIQEGARAGEWVIVNGLQRVRPGVKVEPKRVPMPLPPDWAAGAGAPRTPAGKKPNGGG
jgi:RND family efflux transporter MFP subunit